MTSNSSKPDLAVYIHIPYCLNKCPYCDFNSFPIETEGFAAKEKSYLNALVRELDYYSHQQNFSHRQVSSIFFGGGTPSLFAAASISKIIERISAAFVVQPTCEITLEANPGTVFEPLDRSKLEELRSLGINRLSLGCQSFSKRKLKFLGRIHGPEHSLRAVENFKAAGFENFNLDIMFGLKDESIEELQHDLETATNLSPKHISAYGLTIEPETEFGRLQKLGGNLSSEEDMFAEMYLLALRQLEHAGFRQYEISNFAKPDFECAHNLTYWSRADCLGLGAGAHSFLSQDSMKCAEDLRQWGTRWINTANPKLYLEKISKLGRACEHQEVLSKQQAMAEFIFTGLRKKDGFLLSDFSKLFGEDLTRELREKLGQHQDLDLLIIDEHRVSFSEKGFLFSDYIFADLVI